MFANNVYAKIWKLDDKGKYYNARMSTSRKLENGQYETDWQDNFTRLVGTAANQVKAGKVKEGDRVQIGSCGVTNHYDKEKKTTYTNYVIFSFAGDGGERPAKKTEAKKDTSFVDVPENVEDTELPFN